MKDYEKLAKTAFVNSKEYQQLAERLRNKNKKLIAASNGEFPPMYLRKRTDYKKLKKEVDEYAEKDFFGPTIYKLMQSQYPMTIA